MQSRPPNPQMDISSLPESEQQKLRQLQQQFQEHQAQQQAQQQQQQLQQQLYQAYDPSQPQTYEFDQTNQAYYSYYHQQYPQQTYNSSQQDPQQYPYYQPDYSAAYQHPPPPQQVAAVAAPKISDSGAAQPSGVGQVQAQHQQDANYPVQSQEQQQSAGYTAPPGLNAAAAAAVAALSQLTQFAGTMDAAERAMAGLQGNGYGPMHRGPGSMHPPVGQSPYRGGDRRRGGSLRGGGRGNFGHRHPRSGGSGPPLRGRGRGRGRGGPRRFPPHGAASTSSHPEHSAAEDAELTDDEEESPADTPEEGAHAAAPPELSQSALALEIAAPNRRLPQVGWCELCRVDCNTLEILEQHRNGKRHKKNLQKIEELKNALKPGDEMQNEQKSIDDSNPEASQQPESAHDDEDNNIPAEAVGDDTTMESEQTNNRLGQHVLVEGPSDLQARNSRMNWFDNGRRGMKRKMRGGRGGKRMKTFEGPRRPFEPPKPKVVIPLMCNLCNIKCDTQEVFNRHLSGKKHIAKQKRFEGHQAMYGPMGLQALYPPNPIARSLFHPQDHQQPFNGPQGSFPPPEAFMPSQGHQAASATAGFDPQLQQHPNLQWSEASHS